MRCKHHHADVKKTQPRKTESRLAGFHKSGFTLIEMLVVVAIVLILMGLLMAALPRVKVRTQITQAENDVRQLELAFLGYFSEYKRWPTGLVGYDAGPDIEATTTGIQLEPGVVAMLAGNNVNSMNPRLMAFFQTRASALGSGDFLDPWGHPYKYMLDYNRDDILHIEFTSSDWSTNFSLSVGVWSRGPNGSDMLSDGGYKDDVVSWR
ncbi:MAG: prepilin-type N-terminal cleavage/methylation domain-containing protein [Verrucomicrobia bacterium]|nr:prepilin-type N-terminal cleavage/methylation domain-containing protein [Verrucomicrobiota bacterium]